MGLESVGGDVNLREQVFDVLTAIFLAVRRRGWKVSLEAGSLPF